MRQRDSSIGSRVAKYGFLIGAVLVGSALTWEIVAGILGVTLPGWEHQLVYDAELLGTGVGSLALAGTLASKQNSDPAAGTRMRPDTTVYMTRGLFDVLCGLAADAEPSDLTVGLATTSMSHLDGDTEGIPLSTPVFTHFYMPGVAESTKAVFGIDLGTPSCRTQGLFVSHSQGPFALTKRDDLHAVVFVAVPPWDCGSVAAFDRLGRRHPVRLLDATPPEDPVPGAPAPNRPTGL